MASRLLRRLRSVAGAVVLGLVLGAATVPVLSQGPLTAQIQILLNGANTWLGLQTFNGGIVVSSCSGCGGGTVTSVALSAPSILSVAGSPITTSGTLALSLATQTANTVFAGATSGGAATPAFRALVAADIPSLSAVYAPIDATYITQTTNSSLTNEQALASLSTGLMFVTTTTGAVTSVVPGTGVITGLGVNVGSAGAMVLFNGALGTPSAGTLTNATGLPVSTGISGLGTGIATALAVNAGSAGAPVLFNAALGTPSSGTATNLTGLVLTSGVTGVLPVANGGTNASSASITAFNNITGYTAAGATGTTSTNLVFSASPTLTGTVGAAAATLTGALTVSVNGAVSAPGITGTGTWVTGGSSTTTKPYVLIEPAGATSNNFSTSGTGLAINAASGFSGNLFGAYVNSSSKFILDSTGAITATSFIDTNATITLDANGAVGLILGTAKRVNFSATTGTNGTLDTILRRGGAAATLQMGSDVNGAAVAQTFQAHNGITGTDVAGANLTLAGGKGTGAGTVSQVLIATPTALGSGTTAQSLTTRVTVDVNGLKATGYLSSDGTAGATTTCTIAGLVSITVKNGLITSCS